MRDAIRLAEKMTAIYATHGQCAPTRVQQLEAAIRKLHAAKGRYHSQHAACDLYELIGLPCVRPESAPKASQLPFEIADGANV